MYRRLGKFNFNKKLQDNNNFTTTKKTKYNK